MYDSFFMTHLSMDRDLIIGPMGKRVFGNVIRGKPYRVMK